MPFSDNRRTVLRAGSVLGLTGLLPGQQRAMAQTEIPSCPAGTRIKSARFYSVLQNYEASVGIAKGVGTAKGVVPKSIPMYDIHCEADPPPPPPPKPPRRRGSGLFDPSVHMLDGGLLRIGGYDPVSSDYAARLNFAMSLYWDVGIPGFVRLDATTTSSMIATADLPTGERVSSTHALKRDLMGFSLANPTALASWLSTTALRAYRGSFELSGATITAVADGADSMGVALYLGDYPVYGRASTVVATGFSRSSGGSSAAQ